MSTFDWREHFSELTTTGGSPSIEPRVFWYACKHCGAAVGEGYRSDNRRVHLDWHQANTRAAREPPIWPA